MKRILYLFFCLAALPALFAACDKMDCNGDLDGTWQLTQWINRADGRLVANNDTGIYYYVKLDLMKMRHINRSRQNLMRFRHEGDSLFIGEVYLPPFDSILSREHLDVFGVEPDGKFGIDVLNCDRMVLSTPRSLLIFRKY